MALVESDRVQIRQYLGFGSLWLQLDPRLESAITAIQSTADGGTRPDSSTETQAKALLTKLQGIDTNLDNLANQQGAQEVDGGTKLNQAKEMARLRAMGRMYVHRLARIFDTFPRSDVYSAAPMLEDSYPNYPETHRSGY